MVKQIYYKTTTFWRQSSVQRGHCSVCEPLAGLQMVIPECLVVKSPEITAQEPCTGSCSIRITWSMVQISLLVEQDALWSSQLGQHPSPSWRDLGGSLWALHWECSPNAMHWECSLLCEPHGGQRAARGGAARSSFWTEENREKDFSKQGFTPFCILKESTDTSTSQGAGNQHRKGC